MPSGSFQLYLFTAHAPLVLKSLDRQFGILLTTCDLVIGEAASLEFSPEMYFVFNTRSKKIVLLHEHLG